jgi:hypothetical protein
MLEAPNPHRLHPTFMSYVYKVFKHLIMMWRGIWGTPYTVPPVHVRVDFKENWGGGSLSDVVMARLRHQTRTDCIPHPNHMYTKCFST